MKQQITEIRSNGVARINQLVRAASRLEELRPAFADWSAGEVYVCKKTGDYRYRFGDRGKSVADWNAVAREVFASPAALAFAALVLGDELPPEPLKIENAAPDRANVMALANRRAA